MAQSLKDPPCNHEELSLYFQNTWKPGKQGVCISSAGWEWRSHLEKTAGVEEFLELLGELSRRTPSSARNCLQDNVTSDWRRFFLNYTWFTCTCRHMRAHARVHTQTHTYSCVPICTGACGYMNMFIKTPHSHAAPKLQRRVRFVSAQSTAAKSGHLRLLLWSKVFEAAGNLFHQFTKHRH